MKPVICLDMDAVIADLFTEWFARYNRDYGDDLTVERAYTWDAPSYVKEECGDKILDYLHEPGLFLSLKPFPDAIEVLGRLNLDYELFLVTAPPSLSSLAEKVQWVAAYLPFIGQERLIFSHRKDMIRGDLLFDDAPDNLLGFQNTGRVAVAMDYPYNRHIDCHRVQSWLEFESRLPEWLSR
ncbi:5' nucleotidase, NT5C type [Paenibacillus senegalensis]|uniref:5' nucleotidase, NT5C type n=1 Tax=Paenibacillus senegalensis TaxID=1465766 RepID=UPI00028A0D37|nr:5'-3'-deoxyribonucleotidase [Paenibacillus senegalensis]